MTAMPVAERMTAEEFLAIPSTAERSWAQLVGGELVMDPPLLKHQLVCGEIFHELMLWSRAGDGRGMPLTSIAVGIGPHDVDVPDVHWYRTSRIPARDASAPCAIPDIAVEVRSPSTWRYDIGAKKSGYERAGLPELWLVDTAADEVLVFRRSKPDATSFDIALELTREETLSSPLLPGFALLLDAVCPE
jgi:Uma2 family endonuclease